jgi:predicted amidohydrolase
MGVKAAVIQMASGTDAGVNRVRAEALVREAAGAGAALVALPETWISYGPHEARLAAAEPVPGPLTEWLGALAAELGVTLAAGSVLEASGEPGRCYNTAVVFTPDGRLAARYRKRHLFDVSLPDGTRARESDLYLAGTETAVVDTPAGRLGLAICFDLRFPELFVELAGAGAEVICVPSAFTRTTGEAHWELLVRSRAVDSQSWVVAPNRWGPAEGAPATWGGSMIVDPWGRVSARCAEGEGVAVAEIDPAAAGEVRRRLPLR